MDQPLPGPRLIVHVNAPLAGRNNAARRSCSAAGAEVTAHDSAQGGQVLRLGTQLDTKGQRPAAFGAVAGEKVHVAGSGFFGQYPNTPSSRFI